MIKLMIFDHDMTIVDSSYAIMAGFNYVAEHEGLPKVSHELTMKYIATPIPTFCEGLLGEYRPEWVKLYRECNEKFERELIKPFDDTIPTLTKLREMGVKLAVVSNREKPRSVLERTDLAQYFDEIVGAAEPYGKLPYKPNPAMIDELLKHMSISPKDTAYVGDADLDIVTAIGANVRSIGITKGNFTAEDFRLLGAWKSIDELGELIEIVEKDASDRE
ncbi:MAG: HAD-IA family hydrolase [Synergistaceae bacterium]|nr:HAD-IA family hydrolase [Synergistaceae bacterium]